MEFLSDLSREQIQGFMMFIAGIALVWYVLRKRFNRRGPAGLQQYSIFEVGCMTTIFESVLILLGIAGIGLGGFMVAVDWLF